MVFEDSWPDPSPADFEGPNEGGNAVRRRGDCRAPALKARFVPEGDMLEEDQLTSNPPRSADQRTAAERDEVGAVDVGENLVDEFGGEAVKALPWALHREGWLTAGQRERGILR